MLDPKSIETLVGFGGINGLLRGLGTNADTGLTTTKTQGANSSESSRKPDLGAGDREWHGLPWGFSGQPVPVPVRTRTRTPGYGF